MDDFTLASSVDDNANTQKALIAEAFMKVLGEGITREASTFLDQCLEDYEPEELPDLSAEEIAAAFAGVWQRAASRPGAAAHKAITALKAYDLIEITQPDAPFIVESVMGELLDQGLAIRSMFHPVLTVQRDRDGKRIASGDDIAESMMLVFITRQSPEKHPAIIDGVEATLNDLRAAVVDFPRMQKLLTQEIATLEGLSLHPVVQVDPAVLGEDVAFLRWVGENHFVFLGARTYIYPRNDTGGYVPEEPLSLMQEEYGILRDKRAILRRGSEPAILSPQLLHHLENSEPVTVAKGNLKSRVHRRVYMDYISIKHYGADGKPSGETRFVGLFTSDAYDRPAFEVPLIRRKCEHVLSEAKRIGFNNGGYSEKRLKNILETYPRDELFQMTDADLLRITRGILHISDRPRVKLFVRQDPFDRFISVLLYMPRESYHVSVQDRAGAILAEGYGGRVSALYPYVTGSLLSCVHYIIGVTPGNHPQPNLSDLEDRITDLTLNWAQRVEDEALDSGASDIGYLNWARALPAGYQERYSLGEAVTDIARLSALTDEATLAVRAYQTEGTTDRFSLKIYDRAETAIPLSDILPVLDRMGLKTLEEYGYKVESAGWPRHWVHEFILQLPAGHTTPFETFKTPFEDALMAVWKGATEVDGFNALVLQGIPWREVALLRSLSRYRAQSGLDPSGIVQQQALRTYPEVTRALLDLFSLKFKLGDAADTRKTDAAAAETHILDLLQGVSSLEHDRVLRRLSALIGALLRTNYYQNKSYISFKIASRELADLPEPKPYREIFVWSPVVEGVHLRFGPVARGGLRWSDRKEDFRTEVLGLVKAQQVKNAVIVPVGSKGGFYPKQLPAGGAPDAIRAEAVRAYKMYLSGLLDITDNLDANGGIIAPKDVVAWDAPDPYLVVAADKGTATFSDIANGVARDYGFWLDDAFASGGSVGYDHKAMGITARGAWEAVKRHFRERGKDIQTETFTTVGVGDMSGDVFGNGMLLSKQTKLLAAFDHRDIFIDPNPDPASSFAERERLFALPRSSWQDYDKAKLSAGGGIFSRGLKSIELSPEIKAALDITADALSPFELMQAILKAPAELLYFGGIGTYIKAPSQSHLDVGDKANDAIRVDAGDIRAAVVGEGANLGITQAGRIALSANGVKLNTDAIDNSAGVDCSDHEVNIKILLGRLVQSGRMTVEARDTLLASMTDDVGDLVLMDNYAQSLTLSLLESTAAEDNASMQAFMSGLEKRGKLDRKVEGLPSNAQLEARKAQNAGLYRPELAVVMAYGKIVLFDDLIETQAIDDPIFEQALVDYFPKPLHGMIDDIRQHRLHREIVATVLCNEMINILGPSFPARLQKAAAVDTGGLVLSFEGARRLFGTEALWAEVSALDNQIPAAAQTALYNAIALFLRRQVYFLARRFVGQPQTLTEVIAAYQAGVATLLDTPDLLSPNEAARVAKRCEKLVAAGAPVDLAKRVAVLLAWTSAVDVIDLANGGDVAQTAKLYFLTGERFGFDRLRAGAGELYSTDPWDRMAIRRLIEDVYAEQKSVTAAVVKSGDLDGWAQSQSALIAPVDQIMADIEGGGAGWSFAKLSIVNAVLREWVSRL
ncbi:NAD-glutamate dehydrogenase [Asticcacaulis sp. YBE204]|uniref:NAD-glutamate dehydrogenase n=1 Tax=Asticcacaulis sp. YBE204 TaxID=1282363 RepID=UPI0003C408FA|nr:NAD-glutamate dehydrogenase [Asticcacaulis sp. YBE204]ESQ80933.1 glutamate dehydrogenase [Asticcacaulis sp. YBE204]